MQQFVTGASKLAYHNLPGIWIHFQRKAADDPNWIMLAFLPPGTTWSCIKIKLNCRRVHFYV